MVFIFATGQSKKFFRDIDNKDTKFLVRWHGNLSKGFFSFILGFIPSYIGIIEIIKPIDFNKFEDLFYDCSPSLVSVILMQDNYKIERFINSVKQEYNQEEFEEYILRDEKAVILTVGIGDIPPDKNYEEITTRSENLLLLENE